MLYRPVALTLALSIALMGCADDASEVGPTPEQTTFGPEGRQTKLRVPSSYDHAQPMPLLIVLHGFGFTGLIQLGFSKLADVDALILAPDGTTNQDNISFWNASDACCDYYGSGVDDVAYLGGLLDEVRAVYNVDPDRIYLWGHSNGGFMSYRMACERSEDFAAIISLAGAATLDPADCSPSDAVSVLQVHGDLDTTILFDSGPPDCLGFHCLYPGAEQTVSHWANYNGCADTLATDAAIDLEGVLPGAETTVTRHEGCPAGVDAELWRIQNGAHIPALGDSAGDAFWDWLSSHPKVR